MCHINEPNLFKLKLHTHRYVATSCSNRHTVHVYKEKGQCSPPLSLSPPLFFLSAVKVIIERLDWRQWQKRGGDKLPLIEREVSMLLPHHTLHLLLFLPWSHVQVLSPLMLLKRLHLSFISSYFTLLFSSPRSRASLSLPLSLSPSLSLVFRQWNICSLNILPHYLSV